MIDVTAVVSCEVADQAEALKVLNSLHKAGLALDRCTLEEFDPDKSACAADSEPVPAEKPKKAEVVKAAPAKEAKEEPAAKEAEVVKEEEPAAKEAEVVKEEEPAAKEAEVVKEEEPDGEVAADRDLARDLVRKINAKDAGGIAAVKAFVQEHSGAASITKADDAGVVAFIKAAQAKLAE